LKRTLIEKRFQEALCTKFEELNKQIKNNRDYLHLMEALLKLIKYLFEFDSDRNYPVYKTVLSYLDEYIDLLTLVRDLLIYHLSGL
jgi:hypothetical protein